MLPQRSLDVLPPSEENEMGEDIALLSRMGYQQELRRCLGGFSNFAISFSIICILGGGVSSFHLGLCAAGGASIGIGWLVGCVVALSVAATMGQVASAFPTAGGLYHWSSQLGGRGWGWATAWFNLIGVVTVVSAIDVGFFEFMVGALGALNPSFERPSALTQHGIVTVVIASQAWLNYKQLAATTKLTNFSGWLIIGVATCLTVSLLVYAPSWDLSRLVDFTNYSGIPKGVSEGGVSAVWPEMSNLGWLFCLGLLLPLYTLTGFDASAHVAEETVSASRQVPRGIVRSVLVSGVCGWLMLCAVVIAIPEMDVAAHQGSGAFFASVVSVLPAWQAQALFVGIGMAQYLCGLAAVTSASRMVYAFARDGGLPASNVLRAVGRNSVPGPAVIAVGVCASAFTWHASVYALMTLVTTTFLYISYVMPTIASIIIYRRIAWGPWNLGGWYYPLSFLSIVGCVLLVTLGTAPPNEEAGILLAAFIAMLLVVWFGWQRHRFRGPPKCTGK